MLITLFTTSTEYVGRVIGIIAATPASSVSILLPSTEAKTIDDLNRQSGKNLISCLKVISSGNTGILGQYEVRVRGWCVSTYKKEGIRREKKRNSGKEERNERKKGEEMSVK